MPSTVQRHRRSPRPAHPRVPLAALVALVVASGLTACTPAPEAAPEAAPGSAPGTADPGAATPSAPPPTSSPRGPRDGEAAGTVPEPDEHSAVGTLAPGFPAALLPLPADADVLVSSWAPVAEPGAGQPYDVSLNVRTALPVAEVVDLYRAALAAAGFTETVGVPSAGLAAQSTYARSSGAELVTVGILDSGDERTVTVGGRVRADG